MTGFNAALEDTLGKSIAEICDGRFHSTSSNHCAHFVSHIAGIEFPYNCKQFNGGNGAPANIRVQEIFPACPLVGKWEDADLDREQLVFVTKASNVDLAEKTIVNVPQKHVGIYSEGMVYHYSNSRNEVVKWTPETFLEEFEGAYSGTQELFFGTFPGSDLDLAVRDAASAVPRGLGFDLEKDGRQWFAAPDGDGELRFYVGRETNNGNYVGIFMRANEYYGPRFAAADYTETYDHWAQLLELTGYCESKNYFNVINTYDSAKFTFGFYQLAAHTANDNLILFFRALLQFQEAKYYFPELVLVNGRVHRQDENGGLTDLEVETATGPGGRRQIQGFMDFLNARRFEHDRQEVLNSARVIHWSNNHAAQRDLQVAVSYDILQRKMATRYARWYDLDGQSDVICGAIADIHHQGRASKSRVRAALASGDPLEQLITINPNYANRARALREKIDDMIANGQLGGRRYDAALNEFV